MAWPRRRALSTLGTLALGPWLASPAVAQSVLLSGNLGTSKGILVIDGQMHTVAVGSTVKGVTLRRLGADEAVVEIAGKPLTHSGAPMAASVWARRRAAWAATRHRATVAPGRWFCRWALAGSSWPKVRSTARA